MAACRASMWVLPSSRSNAKRRSWLGLGLWSGLGLGSGLWLGSVVSGKV